MTHQPGEELTPDERSLDEYLDALATTSKAINQPPRDDLQKFAQDLHRYPATSPRGPQAGDPVLNRLREEQRRRNDLRASNESTTATNEPPKRPQASAEPPGQVYPLNRPWVPTVYSAQESQTAGGGYVAPSRAAETSSVAATGVAHSKIRLFTRIASSFAALIVAAFAGAIIYSMYQSWQGDGTVVEGMPTDGAAYQPSAADPVAVVVVDGIEVGVLEAEFRTEPIHTDLADETAKRASFLVVRVTLTNLADENATGEVFRKLLVRDQDGNLYAVDTFATLLENSSREYGEQFANLVLEPNVTHYVDLMFDVDSSSTTFALTEAVPTDADGVVTETPFLIPLEVPESP